MKKALIVATVSGFVPQFEMNNIKILQELGYEVHYASNFHNPHYGIDNHRLEGTGIFCHQVDFVRSPFCVRKNLHAYRQLYQLMKKMSFQLIHCHTPMGGALGRLAAERVRKSQNKRCKKQNDIISTRILYTAHGFHFYKGAPLINWLVYYPVERYLARFTDTLITINEEDYCRAKKFHLRKHGTVEKVNGVGIDINKYQADVVDRERKRKEQEVTAGAFFIVSVGELNRNKNHRVIVKAFNRIHKEGLFYGICGSGSQKKHLEKRIKALGLQNITLYGYREDIEEILAAADAFVFPSIREGLGLAALEALASGLPVIAYDNRGTREYMRDGENGYVIRKNRAANFAEAIQKLCCLSQKEYEAMKLCAQMTAKPFGIQEVGDKMKKIYMHK